MVEFLSSSITVPLPGLTTGVDFGALLLKAVFVAPLIGGYLLAREAKGNIFKELLGVALFVLATVVPATPDQVQLNIIWSTFLSRWPIVVFLFGLTMVQDKGFKAIIGVAVMAISGYLAIPGAH